MVHDFVRIVDEKIHSTNGKILHKVENVDISTDVNDIIHYLQDNQHIYKSLSKIRQFDTVLYDMYHLRDNETEKFHSLLKDLHAHTKSHKIPHINVLMALDGYEKQIKQGKYTRPTFSDLMSELVEILQKEDIKNEDLQKETEMMNYGLKLEKKNKGLIFISYHEALDFVTLIRGLLNNSG